ncbi:hypothetical protein PoB_006633300 [Plakobranchus ocellatus]|uniref:Uncharacterized protein n=1 Tax=Plakobranchus ocellatus TaxID=259542 RepID=A0AAV4D6P1_9GAST|nr:hypothetical protein PoB_006633300 [Plakobranchus ocellatus]
MLATAKSHRPSHCFATTPIRQSPRMPSRYCPHETKLRQWHWWPDQDKGIENFICHCMGSQQSGKFLLRNYHAIVGTPQGKSPDEVMCNRPLRLPFQIPASSHRARPPSPQLATSAADAQGDLTVWVTECCPANLRS